MTEYNKNRVFAAVIGPGEYAASCATWLDRLGVPSVFIENAGLGVNTKTETPFNYSEFIPECSVSKISDDGDWFKLELIDASGVRCIEAKYLVASTFDKKSSGGLHDSDTIFIGNEDSRISGDSSSFFSGKCVGILGGGDSSFDAYKLIKKQSPREICIFAKEVTAPKDVVSLVDRNLINDGGYDVRESKGGTGIHVITTHDDPYSRYGFHYLVVNYGTEISSALSLLPSGSLPRSSDNGFILSSSSGRTSNDRIFVAGLHCVSMDAENEPSSHLIVDGASVAEFLEQLYSISLK